MNDRPLVRHRLMFIRPILGCRVNRSSWHVFGAVEALHAAEIAHADSGIPVMVCEAPEGGIVTQLYTVGAEPTTKVKR